MTDIRTEQVPAAERPLVTFALFAYNQEKYIREAVESALAQTYEPLEIIISDDCSTDKTFQIIQRMVAEYVGPHSIRLNCNNINCGIGEHVNAVIALAEGELIVFAAGDDISSPDRTHALVNRWLDSGKVLDSVWSSVDYIDANGKNIGEWLVKDSNEPLLNQVRCMVPCLLGCSQATTKRLFNKFDPLSNDVVYEDRAIAFRAIISGGLASLPQKLVKYRIHQESVQRRLVNSSSKLKFEIEKIHLSRRAVIFRGYKHDLCCQKINLKNSFYESAYKIIEIELRKTEAEILMFSSKIIDRLRGFLRISINSHTTFRNRIRYFFYLINPFFANAVYIRLIKGPRNLRQVNS